MNNQSDFNLNSLKWVKQEIDASLTAARVAIEEYAADSSKRHYLEESLSQVIDALGTLDIAEIRGGALLAREIRDVLEALRESRPEQPMKEAAIVSRPVVRAIIQLSDYLDYIEAGNPDVPVVLVNAINDLRLMRHADLISEGVADIPGLEEDDVVLSRQPRAKERIRDMAAVARHVFELGLLGWYRNKNVKASLNKMAIVCRRLKMASAHNSSRRLWWISEALVSGLRSNVLPHSYSLKFLVGRIDREIKHLQKVGDDRFASQVPMPLVRSMLYYIASAHRGDPVVDEVRNTYFPEQESTAGAAVAAARVSVSGQNHELYRTLANTMAEKIATLKDEIELHVLAKDGAAHLEVVGPALKDLAQTLKMLGLDNQRAHVLEHLRRLEDKLAERERLESQDVEALADMLLGVESAVQAFSVLGPSLVAIAAASEQDSEVKALVADEEFRQIRTTVIRESQDNLDSVKAAFQTYIGNPNVLQALAAVPETLGQIAGAMLLVSEEGVAELLDSVSRFVQRRIERNRVIEYSELEGVAEAISSVEVYLEILDTSDIRQTLYLDKGRGAVAALNAEAEVAEADPTRMFEHDALLDDPARLFNPETLIVDFKAIDEAVDAEALPDPLVAPERRTDATMVDLEETVASESAIFEAETLAIAGIEDQESLDILDMEALNDDEPSFVEPSTEDRQSESEAAELCSDSQLLAMPDTGGDEELLGLDLTSGDEGATEPGQSEIGVLASEHPAPGEVAETDFRNEGTDSPADGTDETDDQTEVVALAGLENRSVDEEGEGAKSETVDAQASPESAGEAVEPPTLTISGIEVEELTSMDEALPASGGFPPLAGTPEAEEVLDTLMGMQIDDGSIAEGVDDSLVSASSGEATDSIPFDSASSLESDLGTASAFLFPDDSQADSSAPLTEEADLEASPDEALADEDVSADAEEPLEQTGVRKLRLTEFDSSALDDVEDSGDGDVLTLVDILPEDEAIDADAAEAASDGESPEPVAEAVGLPAGFDGLSVLKPGADEEIIEIFHEEFAEEAGVLEDHFPQWRDAPENRGLLLTLRRSFHTLKGSARLVGAEVAGEFAWLHEKLLNELLDNQRQLTPEVVSCIGSGIALLPRLQTQLQEGREPDAEIAAHARRIDALLREPEPVGQPAEAEEPQTLISALEDPALMEIFVEETRANLERLAGLLQRFDEGADDEDNRQALLRILHTLNGSARTAKVFAVHEPSAAFEHHFEHKFESESAVSAVEVDLLRDLHRHVSEVLETLLDGGEPPQATALLERLTSLQAETTAAPQTDAGETPAEEAGPGVSRELVEVFLDESEEILEHCDDTMQRWEKAPDDIELVRELYRELHTLKGSARMAGLESIGDLAHAVETLLTAVEAGDVTADKSLFTVVFGAFDRFGEMNARVRAGHEPAPADALIELMERIQQGQRLSDEDLSILRTALVDEAPAAMPEPDESPAPVIETFESQLAALMPQAEGVGGAGEMLVSRLQDAVKVSPDLLDQFVDSVGEINILNSRVEQQVSAFGFNLQELERTISRLTEQLRQLEMEAEAQILSHFDGHRVDPDQTGINEYFDPLELDRYSTIQQLSRALAESTDDLVSLHQLLSEERRDVENLLAQEARIGNSLQDALMRTRMSPFKVMGPRLRRVVRGVALELGKEVDFTIDGEEQELDRKVLEGMVVPLEHLLRNALAHGIEAPEARLAAGKPEAGRITIRVERDGPEVVIEVADDGAGIDREAVRRRAVEKGIIAEDAELTDAEIHALILHPGFSTATEISQISGRGVGMDVVQEQLRHLNGLLEIHSSEGEGTTFRIRLPFTMAINQALLVRVGAHSYAIPINTIEGVVQVADQVLAEKLGADDPVIEYADRRYRLHRLDELLENRHTGPFQPVGQTQPVLLVAAGEQAIALIVDEIQGNQDVVVKPIGALLNSVPGLGGATILGDGRVVLILDTAGIVRVASGRDGAEATQPPVASQEGDRSPTVMVVDDSITIRRVTEKMLERHHFNVVTAKDGLDALARLEEVHPDVMLLDIEMPRMDGFELAAQLQGSDEFQDLPIIMISSRTGKKHRERAAKLGVREFLGKPYQDSELLSHIEALLQQKEGVKAHVE